MLNLPTPILIHLFTAIPAAVLGAVILTRRKGTLTHKLLGRIIKDSPDNKFTLTLDDDKRLSNGFQLLTADTLPNSLKNLFLRFRMRSITFLPGVSESDIRLLCQMQLFKGDGLEYLKQNNLDKITFKPIPDTVQREATLKTGGVDMLVSTDPLTIKRFSGKADYQVVDTLTGVIGEPSVAFIMLNTVVPPTDDIRIRQALAKGLDQATVQKIFGAGYGKPLDGIFLPDSPYYKKTSYPTYDPAGAKKLVAQYKAEHGTPKIELITITDPRLAQVVQIIQQMWNQVGFEVTISQIQQANLVNDFVAGKFQAATSYQFGNVTPDLNYVWWSETTVKPVGQIGLNFARNSDPIIEENMLTARHTSDTASRTKAYQAVNEQLAKDLPYLWLQQYLFSAVAVSRVQNFANPTLPSGAPAYAFDEGIFSSTAIWLSK